MVIQHSYGKSENLEEVNHRNGPCSAIGCAKLPEGGHLS